ncbi:MAG: transcriptional regulator, CdaR [Pseudonocardia sp.]|nr:transcriptional regulator, CdaR [Pseudonocardia sp.]
MSEPHLGDLRRRRELVNDLVAGTDNESAYARARELGHDLHEAHLMVVTRYRAGLTDGALARSVQQAAQSLQMGPLMSRRRESVLLLAQRPADQRRVRWGALHEQVNGRLGGSIVEIGVGRSCEQPTDVPRSWREALRAVAVRHAEGTLGGLTQYDELHIQHTLPDGADVRDAERFVRRWLGRVLDYDVEHSTSLRTTLSTYLRHNSDLTEASAELSIHRSTLRYRLQLIRSLSLRDVAGQNGIDIGDPGNRQSLQVAVWVSQILDASLWGRP